MFPLQIILLLVAAALFALGGFNFLKAYYLHKQQSRACVGKAWNAFGFFLATFMVYQLALMLNQT